MIISYTQQSPLIRIIIAYNFNLNLKERQDVLFVDCEEEDLSSRTGAQFYLGKYRGN